jgi:MSHA biogenesis protein MshG
MSLFSSQISTKTMVPLCRQLATSYGAGIPITRSLELICANTKDKRVREVFGDIRHRIREGATLEEAARIHAQYLPAMFVELLASGEMGGNLDAAFLDLASYYEDRLEMRRTIVGKAAYPMLQLATAWFLGTFALGIVRSISFVSKGFSFGGYLESYLAFQMKALAVLALVVAGCVVLSRLGIFQWIWGWVATYLWPLSAVTLRFAQARFFRSLALLISSGVPIVKAIERSASVTANPYVRNDLLKAVPRVKRGDTLVEAFRPCRFLSSVAREMLSVGEESGRLEETLRKVAQYQMSEAVHAVNVATRVGEVVIALVMAVVVGYIVISFYLNYYGRMMDELRI